jgi:proteasome accessory factor C
VSRPLAEHELSRILALVPWIVAHPGRPKTEVAERFGISVEQLDSDLDLVLMIGVPPYSPAEYIDVDADGDTVTIRLADYFRRPLRLDPGEGLALLAAGRALLAVPGSDPRGPLATALEKLEAALELPDLVVAIDAPEHLEAVRAAAEHDERLEIDYWSAGRDELTTRRIDPTTVFFALGEWYVNAWCHRAGDERLFRVDRIRAVRPTGERFEAAEAAPGPGEVYRPRADDPRVTLLLPASAAWVAESYPAEAVDETDDGRLRVRLAVSEPAWLARLLLRVGRDASVDDPPEMQGVAADAAARITARYLSREA